MYEPMTRSDEFSLVYRRGKLKFGRFLAVHALANDADGQVRIGFSVSKKVGKAVVRNLVKRRLREIVKMADDEFKLKPGYWLVIGAKSSSKDASFWELKRDLLRVLKGLEMVKEK